MRTLLSLLFITLLGTCVRAQTSLFDRAVILDSLYNRVLDGEAELAAPFFAQLRGLYPGGENLTNEAVQGDITEDNKFLMPKLNYVYNLLDEETEETAAEEIRLTALRDTLVARAYRTARSYCPEGEVWCGFAEQLDLILDGEAQTVRAVRLGLSAEYAELAEDLRKIEIQLYEVDVLLDRLKRQDQALFRDGDDVGLGLPVGAGSTVEPGFAPVIVESAGSGSAQGALIDGASRWIAERMREELSIAFFDRFEVWMEEKKVGHLFPNTIGAMNITSTTDYALMLQVLRNAFEEDLEELPFNIGPFLREELAEQGNAEYIQDEADEAYVKYRFFQLKAYDDSLDAADPVYDEVTRRAEDAEEELNQQFRRLANSNRGLNYVLFSIAAMRELSEGNHPANLLAILNERSDDLFPQGGHIRPALMLSDVLLRSFVRIDPKKGTTWVSRKELTRLSRDQQLRDIYFGLVLHEVRRDLRDRENRLLSRRRALVGDLPWADGFGLLFDVEQDQRNQIMETLKRRDVIRIEQQLYLLDDDRYWLESIFSQTLPQVGKMLNELSLFTTRMDNLQQQYTQLRASGQAGLGNPQMVELIRHSLTVIRPVLNVALKDEVQLDRIQNLSDGILNAYTGVLEKDYDAVILNVIPVANTLLDVDYEEAVAANAGESEIWTKMRTDEHGARKRKLQEVFRYGAFLAAVAESKSPEDIKLAIRAIALPTGSYSIKRRSFGNISLNAYPGLTGGLERIQNDLGARTAPNFGFTAPVGLAFSWGYRGKIDNKKYVWDDRYRRRVDRSLDMRDDRFLTGHSGSIFFSLLDLGAVVLFRLDGNDNSLPEDVGLQQVFSPGVMYSHGFANVPLSVQAGVQISPQLRQFGEAPADSFRFNLGVTVDLPMANFHTRSVEREEKY